MCISIIDSSRGFDPRSVLYFVWCAVFLAYFLFGAVWFHNRVPLGSIYIYQVPGMHLSIQSIAAAAAATAAAAAAAALCADILLFWLHLLLLFVLLLFVIVIACRMSNSLVVH